MKFVLVYCDRRSIADWDQTTYGVHRAALGPLLREENHGVRQSDAVHHKYVQTDIHTISEMPYKRRRYDLPPDQEGPHC